MKTIETHARAFLALNILAIGRVHGENLVPTSAMVGRIAPVAPVDTSLTDS